MIICCNNNTFESNIIPNFIKYNDKKYMIIPDYYQKIDHVIYNEIKFIPEIIPDWIPFSIFKLDGIDIDVNYYDKFSIIPGKEFTIKNNNNRIINKNYMLTYHKIIPKCLNSPRIMNYSFNINFNKNDFGNLKNSVLTSKNKLFGLYYYNEEKIIHYFPISIILNIINGANKKVISLNFTSNKVKKIGKTKIKDNKIYNYYLKMNIPVDLNLMIEGNDEKKEIVEYNNKIKMETEYYQVTQYKGFVFRKGNDSNNISKNNSNLIKYFN